LTLFLGQIDISDVARRALVDADQDVAPFLARHQRGDRGEVDDICKAHNNAAAIHDLDVTCYYQLATGAVLTVMPEYDRAVTRVNVYSAV
jgi:hypothetical protein